MLEVDVLNMIVNIAIGVRQIYLKHAQPQAMLTIMLGKSTSSMHNLR
jgi:hypothetical protein